MKKFFIALAAFLNLAVCPFICAQSGEIRITGSDIIGEKIIPELKRDFDALGVKVSIDMHGSRDAILDLSQKRSDIAIAAFLDGDTLPKDKVCVPYAHQIAVIIVNSGNPIEEISFDQLSRVFGSTGEKIEKWQAFGLNNEVALRNISPMAVQPRENVTLELFKAKVLGGANIAAAFGNNLSSADIVKSVSNTVNAIAIVSSVPSNKSVKALGVSASLMNPQYFKPTPENVHNGDYPLTMHFYLVYNKEDAKKLRPVIQELFSDAIADKLAEGNFVPAPKNFRKSYTLGLDIDK